MENIDEILITTTMGLLGDLSASLLRNTELEYTMNEKELIPEYDKVPDCDCRCTPELRLKRKGRTLLLQQKFIGGYGSPFWAPIPIVEEIS